MFHLGVNGFLVFTASKVIITRMNINKITIYKKNLFFCLKLIHFFVSIFSYLVIILSGAKDN